MKMPYHLCPSFEGCSCNHCPLDQFMSDKGALPGDGVCRAEKPTRIRIASNYSELTMQGLTYREFKNKQRWDALPAEKKQLIATRLEKARKIQQERLLNQV
jgi:hypothetical protein